MFRMSRFLAGVLTTVLILTGCSTAPTETPAEQDAAPETQPAPTPTPTPEPLELIGGGQDIFPQKRFIALYGHPSYPELGALGEQGPQEAAQRVIELAEYYEAHTDEQIIPTFEIIVTMASASAGEDGNYSAVVDAEDLEPYLEAAREHDIYVVLDLQPGRADFLSQAKLFEKYLRDPNVGLALDPEWRLAPGQVHMRQIGSVDAAEINETLDWLADFTAAHELPQKMVVLHQFRLSMIRDRQDVTTTHPEIALVLHADGHGTSNQKLATWDVLRQDLPEEFHLAWKNFYRQDQPMYSPKETFAVEPMPWFVSYQ